MKRKLLEWYLYHFKNQHQFIYCTCGNELIHNNSKCSPSIYTYYQFRCPNCGRNSVWQLDTPVPLLIFMQQESKNDIGYIENYVYIPTIKMFHTTLIKEGDNIE